ncbi:MFS transporter [Chitiniphilus eburneus]|uniref:Uncharacterized MFS-type transporter FAZ21_03295 n=1 Tax=Chitiniphilus eburneus TaxID=2571148 RepID=A0A4U0Q822_9NEIS|nr:MFS transporter [Chitiniphilus eburneus]TJZ77379.1 MFS transporter [Chitiniphilus eburneus]
MPFLLSRDATQWRLLLLIAILFISYLCIGMSLPVVPVYITGQLGLGNVWAGLGVGIVFFATIVSRGHAGSLSDRLGAKVATGRGLACYVAGALVALVAGLPFASPWVAFLILLAGRLLLGLGESLVVIGVIAWGIGLVGPARSGSALALIGAAVYGALAVGGPIGLALFEWLGFAGTMAVSALLPGIGLVAIRRLPGVAAHPGAERPPFRIVLGRIWAYGSIICLQGIGFAAISAFFVLHFRAQGWPHAGLGLTAFGGGFVLVRALCGRLPDRIGGLPVAIGSLAVEIVGQALIWGATSPALALAGAFLTGVGCSMIFPAIGREVVHRVAPHLRGTALGGFSAFQDIAYGLTGPLAGFLADRTGYADVFLVGSLAAAAGLAMAIVLHRATTP